MWDKPNACTVVMAGVQASDKPDARSAMENNATKVACLLSHRTVFLSLDRAQVLAKPGTWTLVTAGAQARDEPNMQRSVPEHNAVEAGFEISNT